MRDFHNLFLLHARALANLGGHCRKAIRFPDAAPTRILFVFILTIVFRICFLPNCSYSCERELLSLYEHSLISAVNSRSLLALRSRRQTKSHDFELSVVAAFAPAYAPARFATSTPPNYLLRA